MAGLRSLWLCVLNFVSCLCVYVCLCGLGLHVLHHFEAAINAHFVGQLCVATY